MSRKPLHTNFLLVLFKLSLTAGIALLSACGGGSSAGAPRATVNTTPAPLDDALAILKNASSTIIDVLANDGFGLNLPSTTAVTISTPASNGTATVNLNGTADDPTDDTVSYIPDADYHGTDNFQYTIADADGETAAATVFITIIQNLIDIKDAIFSATSGDCTTYDNAYEAAVTDIKRSVNFDMDVVITAEATSCSLDSNSIPNHDFNDMTASFAEDAAEINRSFTITRNPTFSATTTVLSQSVYNAVMLNGVVLDLLSAGCYKPSSTDPLPDPDGNVPIGCDASAVPWLLDPLFAGNTFGTDIHNAHVQPDGTYHYHGNPIAMFDDSPDVNGSPVIGFAADGFPVYGAYFDDGGTVRKALSSYDLIGAPALTARPAQDATNPGGNYDGTYVQDYVYTANSGDLDECNGMTVNGQYAYYVTDAYPWVMSCFKGLPDNSFNKTP